MGSEPSGERTRVLPDAAATEALGRALGALLRPGQALGLVGELGAGKTCLARGIAAGLGVDEPEAVASPTYLLVVEHPGRVPMLHADAYLREKTRAFLQDGGVDYLGEHGGVLVMEWADRVADLLPPGTLWVELRPAAGGGRTAVLRGRAWLRDLPAFGAAGEVG